MKCKPDFECLFKGGANKAEWCASYNTGGATDLCKVFKDILTLKIIKKIFITY